MLRIGTSLATCLFAAYGQPEGSIQFEVASIRRSSADQSASSGINTGNGRLTANNVTLKRCIVGAYGVGPNQVSGGPSWIESDRFEITAKAGEPVGDSVLMTMLKTLLAQRFKLAVHMESKTIQAYVLEVSKNGPKFEKGDGSRWKANSSRGGIVAANITMDNFAEILSRQMDLPVVNRTGLEGIFNLGLLWTPESPKQADGSDPPSIFTAIQEQLGLRLRSQKMAVETLFIDHAERPSEN